MCNKAIEKKIKMTMPTEINKLKKINFNKFVSNYFSDGHIS